MYRCEPVELDFFERAPHVFRASEIIAATPAQIFAVFEDAHSWTVWAPPIQKVEWTSPQPFGVGTTRTVSMMGGLVGEERFIAWEAGKHMAFCFTACSQDSMSSFAEDYRVTELGDGRCRVEWAMAMEPKGYNRAMMKVFGPVMGWSVRWMFARFRRYVEAEADTAVVS